jgi:acetolactate synthase-1/2/3 large subunit
MTGSTHTCSQAVVEAAHAAGSTVVFANPGTTEMWLVAALAGHPGMRSILGLHESVCSGACDGYGRMARQPALCLLHLGPGLANAISNLHNARRARSPIVVLIGDMSTWHRDADALLNMDIEALASTVSCSTNRITAADKAPAAMRAAIAAALAPKPVDTSFVSTLILPHDLSWTEVSPAPHTPTAAAAGVVHSPRGVTTSNGLISEHPLQQHVDLATSPEAQAFVRDCAAALKAAPRGKVALLLGGQALLADGEQQHARAS